jgi:hypothetical protein
VLTANGLIVAPNLVLTVLPGGTCTDPQAGGRKAKAVRQGKDGLTLFEVPGLKSPGLSPRASEPAADMPVVVLSLASKPAADPAAQPGEELLAAPGETRAGAEAGINRVAAPVQGTISGAAVFDRTGALAGLILPESSAPKRIAGIIPQTPRPFIGPAALASFLPEFKNISGATAGNGAINGNVSRTGGEIVAVARPAIVSVMCMP